MAALAVVPKYNLTCMSTALVAQRCKVCLTAASDISPASWPLYKADSIYEGRYCKYAPYLAYESTLYDFMTYDPYRFPVTNGTSRPVPSCKMSSHSHVHSQLYDKIFADSSLSTDTVADLPVSQCREEA